MNSLPETQSRFVGFSWKKAIVLAVFLVACDPFIPGGSCDDRPPCSTLVYGIRAYSTGVGTLPQDITGAFQIDSLGFELDIHEIFASTPVAAAPSGRPGFAYALSCVSCTGPYLDVDSLYFTTDILLAMGDTLKAGYNFASDSLPEGFSGSASYLTVNSSASTRFKDSIFEVRFRGHFDTIQKSGSATLRIINPALLF